MSWDGRHIPKCQPGPKEIEMIDAAKDAYLESVADAIDEARYHHPKYPRERDRPFSEADRSDREYALRLARAALAVSRPEYRPADVEPRTAAGSLD